jgi:hypothetical protein
MLLPFEEEQMWNRTVQLAIATFLTLADTAMLHRFGGLIWQGLVGNPLDKSTAARSACHMGMFRRNPLGACVPRLSEPLEICFAAIY